MHALPLTGQAKAINSRVQANDYAPDIAPSIQSEFRTAAKLSSRIAPVPRSILDLRSLAAKPLVYADGLQANSWQLWSTDFLKQSKKRWRGRVRIHTL